MSLLKWQQKYAVGVKALDHHRNIFIEILNELHAASMKGQAKQAVGSLFRKLKDYAREYHSAEERLLEAAKFPALIQHRDRHCEFAEKLTEFERRHEEGDNTVYVEMLRFLRNWLDDHMLDEDQHYRPLLSEREMA
jgi:hemerythrin-like metal-binding protein